MLNDRMFDEFQKFRKKVIHFHLLIRREGTGNTSFPLFYTFYVCYKQFIIHESFYIGSSDTSD